MLKQSNSIKLSKKVLLPWKFYRPRQ